MKRVYSLHYYHDQTMKQIILGVVGVVVIAAGLYYFVPKNSPSDGDSQEVAQPQEAGTFSGSFEDLARRGGDWKCTFSMDTQMGASRGTVYVSGEKIRGDFESEAPIVGKVESHMIADKTHTYTWTSMMPQGFKIKRTDGGGLMNESAKTSDTMVDANMKMSYDCNPEKAAESMFVVPSTITFTEIN